MALYLRGTIEIHIYRAAAKSNLVLVLRLVVVHGPVPAVTIEINI
jgi:hypothetical protein